MLFKKQAVHDAWAAAKRTLDFKVVVKGKSYTATDISTLSYDSGAMNGEALTLGSTYTNTIKITFSHLIEDLALLDEITPQIGIQLPDGTWDFTSLGLFIIDAEVQQDRNNNTTTVSASDRMCMMGGTYESKLSYPAAINDVAVEIANMAGMKVNVDDFARLPTEKILSLGKVTYRDAIGYVAQFAGGFATFDRDGLLDIRVLSDPDFTVTPDQYQSKGLTKNEAFYRIGGLTCSVTTTVKDDSGSETQETTTLQAGSTAGTQIILNNPGMTQTLLDGLYEQLQDLNFYPFSLSWFGDPSLEAGDWITVQDTAGNEFKTPNLLYSLTFGGGVTATSKADTTITASANFVYRGATNQIITNIRRYLNAAGHAVSEGIDEPTSPKAGDIWFKKEGPDTTIMTYVIDQETGVGSWHEGPSTKVNAELQKLFEDLKEEMENTSAAASAAADAGSQAVTAGQQASAAGSQAVAAGSQAISAGNQASLAGSQAAVASKQASAAGSQASAAGSQAISAGNQASYAGSQASSAGNQASLAGSQAAVAGKQASAAGSQAVIAGQQASAAGADAKSAGDFAASAASQSTIETSAARSTANSAVDQANLAVSQAGFANDAADQAKTAAANAQADAANALSGTSLAQQDATKALASAQAALTSVTAANDTANRADSSASAAQASAQAAIKSAQTALSMASGADAKAEAAAKVATTADSNATDALSGANIALDSAATALNQARSAGSAATSTAIIAKSNQSAISTLATKTSVNTLTSQVASTATLQKQTADELLSKADSSVVDTLTSTANSTSTLATQTATALKSKAEISTVNTVNSTATSAATLATQTATTLKSKADSTTVDKLTGRVSSAESKLTQTATKAELALTQNDIDDLGDTVSSQGVKLAATATAVELAATQDNVDTLKKTVTNNTAGVTANAKQIALKANQTDVDTLKGTVTSQGAQVAVTASQVALKADTTTVNNLGKTVASQGAQLSLTATEVDLEAAQSAVDAVTKTATSNAAGIATNANAIKLKADSSTVSTLDGRVSTLSGQLDVQANLISAKVTASDVTGMLNGYATQSWSQGQISAAKNEISASVETVQNQVNNSAVGTNLVAQSDLKRGYINRDNGEIIFNGNSDFYVDSYIPTSGSTVFTLSSPDYVFKGSSNCCLAMYDSDKKYLASQNIITATQTLSNPNTAYIRFSINFVQEGGTAGGLSDWLSGHRYKFEKGSVATDWSLAPEDQATVDWTKSQLDVSEGKVTAQVQSVKTDLTNTLNNNIANATAGMATQTWTQGKLDLTADGFKTQISSVQDGLDTKYTSLEETLKGVQITANNAITQGQLTLLSDQFTSTISGISVGGTNLLTGTSSDLQTAPDSSDKLNGGTFHTFNSDESSILEGSQITVRVFIHNTTTHTVNLVLWTGGGGLSVGTDVPAGTDGYSTITAYSFPTSGTWGNINIRAYTENVAISGAQYKELKLEKGNKATSWSPAPEDVQSQFTQLQNDINLRVKTGDLVSQIDVNAKRILLDGASTYITNTTHIDTGVIKTAMIADAAITNGKIANAAIDNAKIANASITAAKIADLAVGSAQIADGAISNAKIGALAVNTAQIANGAINSAKIAELAVGTAQIADAAINSAKIASLAVGTAQIADGAISNAKIGALAVNTAQIANGAINSAKIAELAVGTAQIADAAINNAKIANTAIDNAKIANAAITAAKIADLAVGSAQIADGAISSAKIGNAAITTAKIGDAQISSAKIISISADKITAGTLDAAKVNVVNLNASNITTGTISGANLSINLTTGQVLFQKGRIHSTSNNIDINVDQGYVSVANGNARVMLKNGGIQFVQPNVFDVSTNPYLSISNGGSGLAYTGARIVGRDYVVLSNSANASNIFDQVIDGAETFAGISMGYDGSSWHPTKIGGADRGIILSAGQPLSSNVSSIGSPASITIGTKGQGAWGGNRIELTGEYVHSLSTYTKTSSGSANVIVAQDGALIRSTSAAKYKTDIQRTMDDDYGQKLLDLPTATWLDKADMKRYSDDPAKQPVPTRNFGMIAEDLAAAGLEYLVVRGQDGQLEGIEYDRIGPALIPVIAKLQKRIEILEQLKGEI